MDNVTETTNGKAVVKQRAKPTLVTLDGGRQITSSGRWNDDLLLQFLQIRESDYQSKLAGRFYPEKLKYGWVDIADIARVAYGQNSLDSKRKTRTALTRLFKYALSKGVLVVVDYDPKSRRALAAKILDPKSRDELLLLEAKANRMVDMSELSAEQFTKIREIIDGRTTAAA